ncbi:hypothetical protein SLA2020_056840 [Shorea laevis]
MEREAGLRIGASSSKNSGQRRRFERREGCRICYRICTQDGLWIRPSWRRKSGRWLSDSAMIRTKLACRYSSFSVLSPESLLNNYI